LAQVARCSPLLLLLLMFAHRHCGMASETTMLSPMPRKSLCGLPTSPYIRSEIDAQEINIGRPFPYDVDEATQELRDALACKMPTKISPTLSAASTCASTPLPRGCISGLSSPDRNFIAPPNFHEMDSYAEHPQCPPGALDKSSWLQARKVFVGGIPQTIDQNGLYQMFSKVGKVKKAWLQLFHIDRAAGQVRPAKKHRGFGFVIFYEKQAIDQLLGNDSSRFLSFGSDLKFEVKRALGKTDEPPSANNIKNTHANDALSSYVSQTLQSGSWVPSPVPLTALQTPQRSSRVPSQAWQSRPAGQPSLVVAFQLVPPFPLVESQFAPEPLDGTQTMTEASAVEPTGGQHSQFPFLPKVLLDGFVGRKPINSWELTQALLQAMPDHYED